MVRPVYGQMPPHSSKRRAFSTSEREGFWMPQSCRILAFSTSLCLLSGTVLSRGFLALFAGFPSSRAISMRTSYGFPYWRTMAFTTFRTSVRARLNGGIPQRWKSLPQWATHREELLVLINRDRGSDGAVSYASPPSIRGITLRSALSDKLQ